MKTRQMNYSNIMKELKSLSNPEAVAGMSRYGINPDNTYGVSIPNLRMMAKEVGLNHSLAQQLWASGIHEARILASMIEDPNIVTEKEMEVWVSDFDSWDVCDQCCNNLFRRTRFAYKKAIEWASDDREFAKRAGFVLMACLAVGDKKMDDAKFEIFLQIIKRDSVDDRNYVKKAVNWALRQIGKRNRNLNIKSIEVAREIQNINSKSAKWIATDAIKELMGTMVQHRLKGPNKR